MINELHLRDKPTSFPRSSVDKEAACNTGDPGSIPELRGSPGAGNGNPLQYPCLENPMDRGAWRATLYGVARVRHHRTLCVHTHTYAQGINTVDST